MHVYTINPSPYKVFSDDRMTLLISKSLNYFGDTLLSVLIFNATCSCTKRWMQKSVDTRVKTMRYQKIPSIIRE